MGILFKVQTVELYEDTSDSNATATNCFIAAGIYGATLLLSLFQRHLNKKQAALAAATSPSFSVNVSSESEA